MKNMVFGGYVILVSVTALFAFGATAQGVTYTNSIGMVFTDVPAGSFYMGGKSGVPDESPRHKARIRRDFQMGIHEVTVVQFLQFASGRNDLLTDDFIDVNDHGDTAPVVYVSWEDVQAFISWLNKKEGGNAYRLPTKAEWEYATRAGTTTKYSWGDSESQMDAYVWYDDNSGGRSHAVGGKRANPWGLYDMHGNVWEWVQDWYADGYYEGSPTNDPQGPSLGRSRVIRGGSWYSDVRLLRSANRSSSLPSNRDNFFGFRLVRQLMGEPTR